MSGVAAREEFSTIDTGDTTARLDDVLRANGEDYLYDQIRQLAVHVEDAPPVIFGWHNVNVDAFIRAIQMARDQSAVPGGEPLPADPLGLPAAVNAQTLKEAMLEFVRIQDAPVRLGTTCLPCSLAQSIRVGGRLRGLELDPWTQRIIAVGVPHSLPIACVYVPRPRSNTLDRVTKQYPNSLWGEKDTS